MKANKDKTKILLANYPKISQSASFERADGGHQLEVITGYDIVVDNHEVTLSIVRDLIMALLTYDEVYVLGDNIKDVCQVWGPDYLKELLRLKLIKPIPDVGMNPVLIRESGGKYHPDFFGYASGCKNLVTGETANFEGPFGHVENWLLKKGMPTSERNALVYLLEENAAQFDSSLQPKIIEEMNRDMNSPAFLSDNSFFRVNQGTIELNTLSALRLFHLDAFSVIAAGLRLDGLKADGAISDLIQRKTLSVLAHPIPDGAEALSSIIQQKGFPDLGQLFVDNVIGLDDILKLRDSINGRQFRYWAKRNEYEEELMHQEVMNSVQTVLGSRISLVGRALACSIFGIMGFVPGLMASLMDSFVINEIARGWHPNLFLDEKLKALLDTRIAEHQKALQKEAIASRFIGVNRNDPCPCGSGKKFKNCHGKI